MKKILIIFVSSLVLIFAVVCVVRLGTFWWVVLRDPQRPEFVKPTGGFVFGPEAQVEASTVTIRWSLPNEYTINSIYFAKKGEKFPNLGGQNVTVQYNNTTHLYDYTAVFLIGLPALPQEGGYPQYIEPGHYTYQVWGYTADYSKKVDSPVLELDILE